MTTEKNCATGRQLYAVIDSAVDGAIGVEGIGGSILYNIPYRSIGAVVGEVAALSDGIAGDIILKYEEVLERLMESHTVLPARFGTVFNDDEEAAAALALHYDGLMEGLKKVRGKLEFGVRVLWDAAKVSMPEAAEDAETLPAAVSGKDYMDARVMGYRLEKALKEKADDYTRAINSHFMGVAAEEMVEKTNGGRLMLSAAFLVDAERNGEFREAFESIRASFPELRFLLSGPWPPYSFIQAP